MLKLHFAPNSRAGRIVWLLEELGLPYDINKMAFSQEDLKSDEHRARHPLGRVPVLDDGDVQIYESGAIVYTSLNGIKTRVKPARILNSTRSISSGSTTAIMACQSTPVVKPCCCHRIAGMRPFSARPHW